MYVPPKIRAKASTAPAEAEPARRVAEPRAECVDPRSSLLNGRVQVRQLELSAEALSDGRSRLAAPSPCPGSENQTGLPDALKQGVESLSGLSMDDVTVHYNSVRPAQLQPLAYAQGAEIHVAPGQERHLAHEAWHVVQQKQGRVRPTTDVEGLALNTDGELEREADRMGTRALAAPSTPGALEPRKASGPAQLASPASATDSKTATAPDDDDEGWTDVKKAPPKVKKAAVPRGDQLHQDGDRMIQWIADDFVKNPGGNTNRTVYATVSNPTIAERVTLRLYLKANYAGQPVPGLDGVTFYVVGDKSGKIDITGHRVHDGKDKSKSAGSNVFNYHVQW